MAFHGVRCCIMDSSGRVSKLHKVELEFKRIQTYLFASPKLRAMLGANASLGKTIRVELTHIAKTCGSTADARIVDQMPSADHNDPLQKILNKPNRTDQTHILIDNPRQLYQDNGVLVRDGGHFTATFASADKAQDFIARAVACITANLPGILVQVRSDADPASTPPKIPSQSWGESLFQHPSFQVSHQIGNSAATQRNHKKQFVSAEEKKMENEGRQFRNNPHDLIGLLEQHKLIPCGEQSPEDLGEVAGDDYLALIHADGNNIGQRYQKWRTTFAQHTPTDPTDKLQAEAHGEAFFHSMRVAVRRGLVSALATVFKDKPSSYQLLMLGGDDLLLVCAARYALPFVCAYAQALDTIKLADGQTLSIGAGVAIAKKTFPFHRLHAVAEELASSAKQRHRADPSLGSVVDWHVNANAWIDDFIQQRRMDSRTHQAVLSAKPYPVLGLGRQSLEQLLIVADALDANDQVARSQLRRVVEMLRQGKHIGQLAFAELPKAMRCAVSQQLQHLGYADLFLPSQSSPHPSLSQSLFSDVVELIEIKRQVDRQQQKRLCG